jgi:hypothetical protein
MFIYVLSSSNTEQACGYIVARNGRQCVKYYVESYNTICCHSVKIVDKQVFFFVLSRVCIKTLCPGNDSRTEADRGEKLGVTGGYELQPPATLLLASAFVATQVADEGDTSCYYRCRGGEECNASFGHFTSLRWNGGHR